jgi:hypothetical protein
VCFITVMFMFTRLSRPLAFLPRDPVYRERCAGQRSVNRSLFHTKLPSCLPKVRRVASQKSKPPRLKPKSSRPVAQKLAFRLVMSLTLFDIGESNVDV